MATSESEITSSGTQSKTSVVQTHRYWYISIVLGIAFLAGRGCWVLLAFIPQDIRSLPNDNSALEIFFSVFGLVYAIIVGLFVIEAHRRMRELSSLIQNESDAADDIIDFLRYFKGPEQIAATDAIRGHLLSFADSLPHNLQHLDDEEQLRKWRPNINEMIRNIECLDPITPASNSALDGLVRKVADLTTFRLEAMQVAKGGFPTPFYLLLGSMPIVVIGGFILMDVESEIIHRLLIATIAVVMWFLSVLVWDLDHPRKAIWNIQDELTDYVSELKERIIGSESE